MKNKCIRIVAFILVFAIIFGTLERVFYVKNNTSETWSMIQNKDHEPLDILFMGNSHIFCTINPAILNESLGLNTAILGSSAQYIDITYENLKVVLKHKKPKAIVLEANVFFEKQSDKIGYVFNNFDGIDNILYKANALKNIVEGEDWMQGIFQLFRPTETWNRWEALGEKTEYNNILGYMYRNKIADEIPPLSEVEEKYKNKYKEGYTEEILDVHKKSLVNFLELTYQEDIPVYIIKAPRANYNDRYVGYMNYIRDLVKNYDNVKMVHDFNTEHLKIGIAEEDFYDEGHLNRMGAAKMSEYFAYKIGDAIGKTPDFSRVNAYKGETVEKLDNGLFRCHVNTFGNSEVSFVYSESGEITKKTDYMENAYIDIPSISSGKKLEFYIKPKELHDDTVVEEESKFTFLKQVNNFASFTCSAEMIGTTLTAETVYNGNEENIEFAFYVTKDGSIIEKIMYSKNKKINYTVTENGIYRVTFFILNKETNEKMSEFSERFKVDWI